jgi:hypothetical protein
MLRPVSKRQQERVFLPYEVSIAKKAFKLEEFMAENEENVTTFNAWRFKSLETQIASLRTQVLRMEADWDEMRDPTMPAATFDKISKLVDDSMATAHCSYLDIYISQKIRLCKGDFEGKFQFNLQAKLLNVLV